MLRLIKSRDSLAKRILLLAITTISLSVILTGGLIALSFDKFQERSLITYIKAYTDTLIAATNVDNKGNVTISRNVGIFEDMPFYWQVTSGNKNIKKAPILEEWIKANEFDDNIIYNVSIGVQKLAITFVKRTLTFPGNIKVVYIFGIPEDIISALKREEKQKFTLVLLIILTILAFALIIIIAFIQLRAITKPLDKIKQEIKAVQDGTQETLGDDMPKEIGLLAGEINKLVNYNLSIIERYRTFAANLSHSLKTPLTVINNELQKPSDKSVEIVRGQTSEMLGIIDRNLARVNAVGQSAVLYTNIEILSLIKKISTSFGKLYNKKIDFQDDTEVFLLKGNESDLYEILGNIIENACKYSETYIKISIAKSANNLSVIVEDDGPGIPPNQIKNVLKHGTRLDTTKPGQGVGLAVANDIIQLYSGDIILDKSALGGLKIELKFPY